MSFVFRILIWWTLFFRSSDRLINISVREPSCSLKKMNDGMIRRPETRLSTILCIEMSRKRARIDDIKVSRSERLLGFNYKIMIIYSIRQIDNAFIPLSFHWNERHIKFQLVSALIIHDCYII